MLITYNHIAMNTSRLLSFLKGKKLMPISLSVDPR